MTSLTAAEATAIETAYGQHVQNLYENLLHTSLGDPQGAVARFAAGIVAARHAKDLALNATIGPTPAVAAISRNRRSRTA